jgi:hypothetical protein
MKITFALLFSLLTVGLAAQKTQIGNAKIQRANAIVWFGVDFTQAYLVGREGFTNPDEIVRVYWNSWNDLMIHRPVPWIWVVGRMPAGGEGFRSASRDGD